jgi:putative ABC transport system permease protein
MSPFARGLLFVRQTWTTTGFAFKRLLKERALSLASVAGLVLASGFIFSVPLYADAVYFRLFRQDLFAGRSALLANRPVDYAPLTFTYEFQGVGQNSPQWGDVIPADTYLSGEALRTIGLPEEQEIRRFHTDSLEMYPPLDPANPATRYFVDTVQLAFLSPLQQAVRIVTGRAPAPSTVSVSSGPIEAMANEDLVLATGVQVGDHYTLRQNGVEIPVTIVGLWRPLDPAAPYWDSQTVTWLLVDEASYTGPISRAIGDELFSSMWTMTLDGSHLHVGDIAALTGNIQRVNQKLGFLLPNAALTTSPLDALGRYQANAPSLTFLLFAFSVPILGLILVFFGLVAGLFVGQMRSEMAILRSRGASRLQVVWIAFLQGILLAALGLAGGVFLGDGIAHAIGRAHSFLNFGPSDGLRVGMTLPVLVDGLAGMAVILALLILLPTLGAARYTIVSYKQERARYLQAPWWQRVWLDGILLVPAGLGLWLLQLQTRQALAGSLAVPDPLKNPLLILVPAIGIFAASLLALRLIPFLMAFLSRVLATTRSVGMLMAARYLSRTPAFYTAPLILLVLTVGLSAFTASLARTLDSQLEKQMYYQVGSDLQIEELGTTANTDPTSPDAVWTFPPVEEHLSLKGVLSATRVGRYPVTAIIGDNALQGTFLGIDRDSFPGAAFWQTDFASQPLGSLMNALAATPDGVLVSGGLIRDKTVHLGDKISFGVKTGTSGQSLVVNLQVVGSFDLFPTWYPDSGPLFVGNLDELYLAAGSDYPHEVWLRTAPHADPLSIVYAVRGYSILLDPTADQSRLVENGLNTFVKDWSSTQMDIVAAQESPDRQGLFGLLSAGFLASALLTVLGFLLYALYSFRRRFIEMGMLRAIGLSIRQMVALLAAELASLILIGIGAGTLLGVLASRLFVPFLQMGATAQAQYPPFQIVIAWPSIFEVYVLFGALFLAALGVLAALLVRMKIFQAVKLGETN